MNEQDLFALSDDELRALAKEMKQSEIAHALLIGVMVGIILYSVAKNTWSQITLMASSKSRASGGSMVNVTN